MVQGDIHSASLAISNRREQASISKLGESTMQSKNEPLTKRITISIEESIRDDLNFITQELNINRSSLVRDLLLDWMISRKLVFQSALRQPNSQAIKNVIGYDISQEKQ